MIEIYNSVKEIEKEYSEWLSRYPYHYTFPISAANKMFERDRWDFFKRISRKKASSRIQYLRILVVIKHRHCQS